MLEDLGQLVSGPREPEPATAAQYYFLTKGIGLAEFNELPIPYIIEMLMCEQYVREKEEKEMKKQRKKTRVL